MPGPNTIGRPTTDNLVVGRGSIFLAPIDPATGRPQAYRHVGNCPDLSISVATETLEHTSSLSGLSEIDQEIVTSRDLSVSFTAEELTIANIRDFFSGSEVATTNASVAGFTGTLLPANVQKAGRYVEILDADGNQAFDVRPGDLTVSLGSQQLTVGTDYELNSRFGVIFLNGASANVLTNADEALTIVLAARAEAAPVSGIEGLTQASVDVALKFIQINAARPNDETQYQFHRINLRPDGDLSLIGEEFASMTFSGRAQQNRFDGRSLTVSYPRVAS